MTFFVKIALLNADLWFCDYRNGSDGHVALRHYILGHSGSLKSLGLSNLETATDTQAS